MLSLRFKNIAFISTALCSSMVFAGGVASDHGLDDLRNRLGAGNEPTGNHIVVAQVEADDGGNYGPDTDHEDFVCKRCNQRGVARFSSVHNHKLLVCERCSQWGITYSPCCKNCRSPALRL